MNNLKSEFSEVSLHILYHCFSILFYNVFYSLTYVLFFKSFFSLTYVNYKTWLREIVITKRKQIEFKARIYGVVSSPAS